MIDASANPASCKRCHGSGFCDSCHQLQGLSKLAPGALRRPESHLQPGWPGGAELHGRLARRDISSCSGCHDQGADSTCVGCHRVGGFAGTRSPHPPSFLRAHDRGDIAKNAMCRTCHG
jgi:hypothetical protein